jgi:hypothetical protein
VTAKRQLASPMPSENWERDIDDVKVTINEHYTIMNY